MERRIYVKKINLSFILALLANGGFLSYLWLERTHLNWLLAGWLMYVLIVLYFLSLLLALIEMKRKANNASMYATLFLDLMGLIVFVWYWSTL